VKNYRIRKSKNPAVIQTKVDPNVVGESPMRGKNDAKIDARGGKQKPKPIPGGKALQRLFNYLGERDTALGDDVVASMPVPKSARPRFVLGAKALRAKPVRAAALAAPRRRTSASKAFAQQIAKAATRLAKPARRGRAAGAKRRAMAPAAPSTVWQAIGPSLIPNGQTYGTNRVDVIGRVSSIAIDPKNAKHILLGAAGGGIWESGDAGATWEPRADQMPSLAIGAIAFNPNDPKKAYAGSGEGNFYANLGAGVYGSPDGGTTWKVIAAAPFVGVGFYDLVVDPKNPKTLYAATTNGFYVSINGGVGWSLKRPGRCWDISVHPGGGTVEILATFADGLFASTNSGGSFNAVALPSAPTAGWSRLAVDRVMSAPDIAYVFGAAGTAAHLWRRSGTAWTKITTLPVLNINQAWYDWYVAVPPDNKGQVFLGAIDGYRGALSGTAWRFTDITTQGANSIHPDQHCLTFAPGNSKVIYAGNDGGIFRSSNSGASWTALNKGLGISEVEYLAGDPHTWKWLMAGTQDNGTIRFTGPTVWDHIADGDGGDCGVNESNPNVVYHSYYNVSLERSNNKGNTWTGLAPPSMSSLFYPPVEVAGDTVAIAGVALVVSRTGGSSWASTVLGLASTDVSSAMRALDPNALLIGTKLGRMLKVAWTGAAWSKTNLASPVARYISCIAIDPSNPQRVWVTVSQPGAGLVFRSDNGGASWVNCTGGLPNIPMNSVVVDPGNYKRVWVAADVGVYETLNLGASWASFSNGLPNAMAADLLFHKQDRMLICATRNRGVWALQVP
jgi:photosystem II stability/assembly factor-like uncharacterized protein